MLKIQTTGSDLQGFCTGESSRLILTGAIGNFDTSCLLAAFYEKLIWSSVTLWGQGLHMHAQQKDWQERKKREKEAECLLAVCLDNNSMKFSSGHWTFPHYQFMVLGGTLPTSQVITWFKPQPISTPDYSCMPWLVQAGQSRSNQRKAETIRATRKKAPVPFCSESLKSTEVLQASCCILEAEMKMNVAKFVLKISFWVLKPAMPEANLPQDFSVLWASKLHFDLRQFHLQPTETDDFHQNLGAGHTEIHWVAGFKERTS